MAQNPRRVAAALPPPREGEVGDVAKYPYTTESQTFGNPEEIIWASIRQLCSTAVHEWILSERHGVKRKSDRKTIGRNIKLYIQQASEFYAAAAQAKANTGPLFYYYSFLNLAKARCEIAIPGFHGTQECYRHGISWVPDRDRAVILRSEPVRLTTRGLWHALWEAIHRSRCPARNPEIIKIHDLFALCPEVGTEYSRTFGTDQRLVELTDAKMVFDRKNRKAWLRLSVTPDGLKDAKISKPAFMKLMQHGARPYRRVAPVEDEGPISFESPVRRFNTRQSGIFSLLDDIRALNLFTTLSFGRISKMVPVRQVAPFPIDQLLILYTLMFWLGSLVRYDPHSVDYLREQHSWLLLDGFMQQSRIWLLELFEWELYQCESTLLSAR